MSEYLHGTDVLVGYNVPEKRWYLPITRDRLQNEMNLVAAEALSLDTDIQGHKSDDANYLAFKRSWTIFLNTIKQRYAQMQGSYFVLNSSNYDAIVDYGRQLNDWRAKFQKFGGEPSTPSPRPESKFPLAGILIGTIVVAGVGAAGYAMSKAGVFAKLFARK